MLGSIVTGHFIEIMTLFGIVLIHELGHLLAAKNFGWSIREVKLLPFGGVVEVEDAGGIPAKEEALVAAAGPLQNMWMALAAWGCGRLGLWDESWATYVCQANLMIGLFNLAPIHPLDGGKLMQAALSYFTGYYKTLVWTARISLALSLAMALSSLLPWLLDGKGIQLNAFIVGLFLFATNWTYSRHVPFIFYRFLMHRERLVERVLRRGEIASPIIVSGRQSIWSVARLFRRERYHVIYISEPGAGTLKLLPEQKIVEGCLSDKNPQRAVRELFYYG